jgi:hypothetical protein
LLKLERTDYHNNKYHKFKTFIVKTESPAQDLGIPHLGRCHQSGSGTVFFCTNDTKPRRKMGVSRVKTVP